MGTGENCQRRLPMKTHLAMFVAIFVYSTMFGNLGNLRSKKKKINNLILAIFVAMFVAIFDVGNLRKAPKVANIANVLGAEEIDRSLFGDSWKIAPLDLLDLYSLKGTQSWAAVYASF